MYPCPTCGKQLTKKSINTVGAGRIDVDYCQNCGGIFFDQGEVNRLSKNATKDLVEETKSHAEHQYGIGTNTCPRCGASLRRFFGESVPDDVHVLRCPDCRGTWFDAENLTQFKEAQEAKLNYFRTWKLPLPSLSAVLIPIALLVTLTGVTLITVDQVKRGTYTQTRAREVLTAPTVIVGADNTTVTIIFTTTEPARTTLLFWYEKPFGKAVLPISSELSTAHQIQLENLQAGKTYYYQIDIVTAEHSFESEEYVFTL
ncbi:zf-TFIIB domain-containing protein [Candidatus Roizmanbacteria bacterium]|nr:zf-TFIIB domain-containing protein [Candidatus Roizmanbacteria bacterium]